MIQISVAQTGIREFKGNSKTSGKPYHLRVQTAYAHTVDSDGNKPPYPEKFELMLADGQDPYPVGEYALKADSVYIDRDGRMACSPHLIAIKAKA